MTHEDICSRCLDEFFAGLSDIVDIDYSKPTIRKAYRACKRGKCGFDRMINRKKGFERAMGDKECRYSAEHAVIE
jgi:hypothetical protein